AYELSTLTGTQVMLLVASETGHVYTFATRKLQPMITSETGKALIQTCLNSPDPCPAGGGGERMSVSGFEETELSYNIGDDEQKVRHNLYAGLQAPPTSSSAVSHLAYPPPHHSSSQHHHPSHHSHQHHMMVHHAHAQSPPSHLIPCSSPGPMLTGSSGYQQQQQQNCPSPLPPHHPAASATYPHMSHSHPQR
ncbi:hypothetical protein LSTR_LSTR016390, partial [Laodelphax striatellus]